LGITILPEGRRKQGLQAAAVRTFAEFHGRYLAFDEPAASRYAALVSARMRAGRPISVEDAQIAAMALAGGLVLATRNVGDFEGIDGLSVVDPFTS
jgi:toxin FitB